MRNIFFVAYLIQEITDLWLTIKMKTFVIWGYFKYILYSQISEIGMILFANSKRMSNIFILEILFKIYQTSDYSDTYPGKRRKKKKHRWKYN